MRMTTAATMRNRPVVFANPTRRPVRGAAPFTPASAGREGDRFGSVLRLSSPHMFSAAPLLRAAWVEGAAADGLTRVFGSVAAEAAEDVCGRMRIEHEVHRSAIVAPRRELGIAGQVLALH